MQERSVQHLRDYVSALITAVEKLEIIPRDFKRYPFDWVATAMMSKSTALSLACLTLIADGYPDEAYGLSRSIMECALISRFITSDRDKQSERSLQFMDYTLDYKNFWLYWSRLLYKGKPEEVDINQYAERWTLDGDPDLGVKHWSESRTFQRNAQLLIHPLDDPKTNEEQRKKEYAFEYFQACQWVHCSVPSLDNYSAEQGRAFVFRTASESVWPTSRYTFLAVLKSFYSVIIYSLYGMNADRPKTLEEIFMIYQNTLVALKVI